MARRQVNPPIKIDLTSDFDLKKLPRHGDSQLIAAVATMLWGPTSSSQVRKWPLGWRVYNGRAVAALADAISYGTNRFDSAPILGGSAVAERAD